MFWKRRLFKLVDFLEILECLDILEIPESLQSVENTGESDHFLEILDDLEISEILELSSSKKKILSEFHHDPLFRSRLLETTLSHHSKSWAMRRAGESEILPTSGPTRAPTRVGFPCSQPFP